MWVCMKKWMGEKSYDIWHVFYSALGYKLCRGNKGKKKINFLDWKFARQEGEIIIMWLKV